MTKKEPKKYHIFQIDINILNIGNTFLLILLIIISYLLYPTYITDTINNYSFLAFFAYYLAFMFIHEIIHSLAYVINGADFSKVTYGICLEKSILCCLCKQNITKKNILWSLMSPLIFIGLITYIIALIFKFPLLFILSIFNIAGSIGDIIMYIFIKKLDNNIEFSEFDNPIKFAIYSNKDISKEKHFGLKYITSATELERNDLRKIVISTPSIIIISLFIIVGIFLNNLNP